MDSPRGPEDRQDDVEGLAPLAELLLRTGAFDAFLTDLLAYVRAQMRHACSVTVATDDRPPYTLIATDASTRRLDEEQYRAGQGPCLEAVAIEVPVVVTDMAHETRWGPYPARATELGARSSMSYPLIVGDRVIGALNMYAPTPLEPDDALRSRAVQLADRVAGALAVGLRIADEQRTNADLQAALSSRSVVDQAIGILVAQQECSVEEAFALLRKTSQTRNLKLRDVAAQIGDGAQRRRPGRPRRY